MNLKRLIEVVNRIHKHGFFITEISLDACYMSFDGTSREVLINPLALAPIDKKLRILESQADLDKAIKCMVNRDVCLPEQVTDVQVRNMFNLAKSFKENFKAVKRPDACDRLRSLDPPAEYLVVNNWDFWEISGLNDRCHP